MPCCAYSSTGILFASICFTHLQKVDKLVMADPQVFIDGIGPLGLLPRFAAELGVKLLQQYWLRESANVVGGAPCLGCARAPPSQAVCSIHAQSILHAAPTHGLLWPLLLAVCVPQPEVRDRGCCEGRPPAHLPAR